MKTANIQKVRRLNTERLSTEGHECTHQPTRTTAYKDIEDVIASERDLVEPLVRLVPLASLKG